MIDIVQDALERNNGVRLAALFDLAAGLMRGDPAQFKLGFPPAGALELAGKVLGLTPEERTEFAQATAWFSRSTEPEKFEAKPGAKLPNGARILLATPAGEYVLVLAQKGDEFVTWKVDPESGDAFWGDYSRDLLTAVEDFAERAGR